MSEASFRKREPSPSDPVVCPVCGETLGTRGGLKTDEEKKSAADAHKPGCKERLDHQRKHRTLPGPCEVERG